MPDVGKIKRRLRELTGTESVEILLGSGTLANDVIAWQLKQLDQPGLVLTSGEFGDRLVDHAYRADLDFQVVKTGANADEPDLAIESILAQRPDAKWLWIVHCETSTGTMIDLPAFGAACRVRGVKLCIDAISTFGLMPVDFRSVYFASAVSGKAVGGYPGLAMVFYSHAIGPARFGIPRYLDLHAYAKNNGIPYTHSSNLMAALDEALVSYPEEVDFALLTKRAAWLRGELQKMGCNIVSPEANTSPAVVTIDLPSRINSEAFGDRLADLGCMLSYRSGYLRAANRVQICMMSDMKKKSLQDLLSHMRTCM